MPSVSQGVFVLAIVWTLWRIVRIRRQLRRGDVLIPPLIAGTLVFALGIIAVIVTGVSPLHLVWWFPCSFIVGLAVLLFPLGTRLLLGFFGAVSNADGEQRADTTSSGERRQSRTTQEKVP